MAYVKMQLAFRDECQKRSQAENARLLADDTRKQQLATSESMDLVVKQHGLRHVHGWQEWQSV